MANVDSVRGFRFVKTLHGGFPIMEDCFIPATDETATFIGDAVKLAGSADAQPQTGAKTVAQLAAGNGGVLGVIASFDQVRGIADENFNLYRRHRPGDVGMYCKVITDPAAIYEVQMDDVDATLAVTDVGYNADVIVAAGNTTTGASGMELDTGTVQNTATLQFKIIDIVSRPDNTSGSVNQKVHVLINNHVYKGHTGTAGV